MEINELLERGKIHRKENKTGNIKYKKFCVNT